MWTAWGIIALLLWTLTNSAMLLCQAGEKRFTLPEKPTTNHLPVAISFRLLRGLALRLQTYGTQTEKSMDLPVLR